MSGVNAPYVPLSAHTPANFCGSTDALWLINPMAVETLPASWIGAFNRVASGFVTGSSTPDVTIADMIGDIDPIKAARSGQDLSNELTVHYGLVPRANRGIFAINELPDLAGKIQVGLF